MADAASEGKEFLGAAVDIPEWTPPPDGDAGTMLQRIFARLVELALQRLNQVPEKNLLAFLDTMGVSLLPPSAAHVPLTFALTPGSPPILVPKGMQAGTLPSGEQPAVIFETADDFTIIPAQLATGFTMDPRWDRYADLTSVLNGQLNILTPSIPDISSPLLRFLDVESIAQSVVQGTSDVLDIRQGKQSRWLQAVLTIPFPDDLVAQALQLTQLKLTVRASGLLPDLAFSNAAPLDVTKDFLPFGEIPKVGDAFFIGNEEAFAKPDATVRLSVKVFPPTFDWEYSSGDNEWTPLPLASINDGTRNFTQNGTISLPVPSNIKRIEVNGESAFWFRVRLAAGPYPGAPRVDEFLPRVHITTLEAPVSEGQNRAVLTAPEFVPVGEIVLIGNEFEFPSNVTGQNTNVLEVIPPFLANHELGTIVRRDWTQVPFGLLERRAMVGEQEIIVPQGEIDVGDVLMLRGPEHDNIEFAIVSGVKLTPVLTLRIFITSPLRFNHDPAAETAVTRTRSRNFSG